jgi:hypothetical protein
MVGGVRRPHRAATAQPPGGRRAQLGIDLQRRFAKQMAVIADDQRSTTLDHAFERLDGTAVPERDPVLVTFDSRCSSACTPRLAATRCA